MVDVRLGRPSFEDLRRVQGLAVPMQKSFHAKIAKIAKTAKNEAEVLIHVADHLSLFSEWFLGVKRSLVLAFFA